MAPHDVPHDRASQTAHAIGQDFARVFHRDITAAEPRTKPIDDIEHVLRVGIERAFSHDIPKLVRPVTDPRIKPAHNLIPAHLKPVCRADHRREGRLVLVMVLVEAACLEEKPLLLLPTQDRAAPVDGATRRALAYARVFSRDQKDDLERQKQALELYCAR